MKRSHLIAGVVMFVALALPALAQDSGVVEALPSATQAILGQGITGAFAVVFLVMYLRKDQQLTAERAALTEKILATGLAQAAENAKTTAYLERLQRKEVP